MYFNERETGKEAYRCIILLSLKVCYAVTAQQCEFE